MPEEGIEDLTNEEKKSCLQKLRKRLSDDEYLNKLPSNDAYLERFLYSTDFNIEKAFSKMQMFYELLLECPDWFAMGSPLDKKTIIEKDIRILTREYDKAGRPIYIVKIGNMDISTMDLVRDIVVVDDFFVEFLLSYCLEVRKGLCVLIDISNCSWRILKWLTPHNIRTVLKRIESIPIKEFKFHVVNNSMMIHAAIKVIWPFLPQHIKEAVKFHFNDRESLYQFIEQEVLPIEYGGQIKMDPTGYYTHLFGKDQEIGDSFKINRGDYLDSLQKS